MDLPGDFDGDATRYQAYYLGYMMMMIFMLLMMVINKSHKLTCVIIIYLSGLIDELLKNMTTTKFNEVLLKCSILLHVSVL
jgi:hypothetical protein